MSSSEESKKQKCDGRDFGFIFGSVISALLICSAVLLICGAVFYTKIVAPELASIKTRHEAAAQSYEALKRSLQTRGIAGSGVTFGSAPAGGGGGGIATQRPQGLQPWTPGEGGGGRYTPNAASIYPQQPQQAPVGSAPQRQFNTFSYPPVQNPAGTPGGATAANENPGVWAHLQNAGSNLFKAFDAAGGNDPKTYTNVGLFGGDIAFGAGLLGNQAQGAAQGALIATRNYINDTKK